MLLSSVCQHRITSCHNGFFSTFSHIALLLVVFNSIIVSPVNTQRVRLNTRQREKQIIDQLLAKDRYDSNIRPSSGPNGTEPTEVTVDLWLRSVSKIDDFKMEYSVQLTMREKWMDDRLKFYLMDQNRTLRYLTLSDPTRVWMPDIFFVNEKQSHLHNIIKPNTFVRIFPDGQVFFSIRISLTMSCPMHLALFPMDTQLCSIVMASYGWTTEDLDFDWKSEDPVQIPDLTLPRFNLQEIKTSTCDRHTPTGVYSCLQVDLILERNFSYYLTKMYIPSIILVLVSWVSFYLDENAAPARTALGITTLLTTATQAASINQNLPPVSYTKASDVWIGVCQFFVFAALVEYAIVNYSVRFDKRCVKRRALLESSQETQPSRCLPRFVSTSKKIDVVSRYAFPALFAIFNIVYWSVYLSAAAAVEAKLDDR